MSLYPWGPRHGIFVNPGVTAGGAVAVGAILAGGAYALRYCPK